MNQELLKYLCCPSCRVDLKLSTFRTNEDEIVAGLFSCKCGGLFPIIDGVPRFIHQTLDPYPEFEKEYQKEIQQAVSAKKSSSAGGRVLDREFVAIHKSFSTEWKMFGYDTDKTWGWELDERLAIFLADLEVDASALSGKALLDAGCGNGVLTSALTKFGMGVVGLDISESVVAANFHKKKFASQPERVHFVQGNLFTPPLVDQSFDYIYSSGVLHHTPDTHATFSQICPLIKSNGRVYIWVYGKRHFFVRMFGRHGRFIARHVSSKALQGYCQLISPAYKLATALLSSLKIAPFRNRTVREISLDLFDAFSPRFNHTHTVAEVRAWFETQGFHHITVSGMQKHGFGVYGDRA